MSGPGEAVRGGNLYNDAGMSSPFATAAATEVGPDGFVGDAPNVHPGHVDAGHQGPDFALPGAVYGPAAGEVAAPAEPTAVEPEAQTSYPHALAAEAPVAESTGAATAEAADAETPASGPGATAADETVDSTEFADVESHDTSSDAVDPAAVEADDVDPAPAEATAADELTTDAAPAEVNDQVTPGDAAGETTATDADTHTQEPTVAPEADDPSADTAAEETPQADAEAATEAVAAPEADTEATTEEAADADDAATGIDEAGRDDLTDDHTGETVATEVDDDPADDDHEEPATADLGAPKTEGTEVEPPADDENHEAEANSANDTPEDDTVVVPAAETTAADELTTDNAPAEGQPSEKDEQNDQITTGDEGESETAGLAEPAEHAVTEDDPTQSTTALTEGDVEPEAAAEDPRDHELSGPAALATVPALVAGAALARPGGDRTVTHNPDRTGVAISGTSRLTEPGAVEPTAPPAETERTDETGIAVPAAAVAVAGLRAAVKRRKDGFLVRSRADIWFPATIALAGLAALGVTAFIHHVWPFNHQPVSGGGMHPFVPGGGSRTAPPTELPGGSGGGSAPHPTSQVDHVTIGGYDANIDPASHLHPGTPSAMVYDYALQHGVRLTDTNNGPAVDIYSKTFNDAVQRFDAANGLTPASARRIADGTPFSISVDMLIGKTS